MKPPIVVVEGFDISVHPTVRHAEAQTEAVDVRDGIYDVYDSEGYLLEFQVEPVEEERHFWFLKWIVHYDRVILKEHIPKTDRSDELREKLIHYMSGWRRPKEDPQTLSLPQLIKEVGKYMPWRRKLL